MRLNPVILLCCCLFSSGILHAQADLPFAFEWKEGKTYWLDVRQEERKQFSQPYPRDFITLERVTWSFQVLKKYADSIQLKAIVQRHRSQEGEVNDGSYYDSDYHKKTEDFQSWNLSKKEFLITVDPQGRVLKHQILLNGKSRDTKSNLNAKPYLWQLRPPRLERAFQWSPAHQKNKYEVKTFIRIPRYTLTEDSPFLQHCRFGQDQQLSIDKKSQWIKYAAFAEIDASSRRNVWLRGWSEAIATVKCTFAHFKPKGAQMTKDEVINYLRFRCGVKAQFDLYTDGNFFPQNTPDPQHCLFPI